MIITIQNGRILQDGKVVGSAMRDFKYGYHPAVLVRIGKVQEWFELDESNLVHKILEYTKAVLKGDHDGL